ncbi:MAG: N-6 DNA methylase [Chitinophagaceae bacterium]|nr:N-6 DNA methylase [Chitinophagaceae bacterium]
MRKNESQKDIELFNFLSSKTFVNPWITKKVTDYKIIQSVLDNTSKAQNQERGEPDFIYVNEKNKLLILVENKDSISDHSSTNNILNPKKYAIDGVKHYLSFFTENNLNRKDETTKNYFKDWNFVGIACSGDVNEIYNHTIDTFIVKGNDIENINRNEILDEVDYLSYFENIDLEILSTEISKSSKELNKILRNLDSQKRPILISALMICLFDKKGNKTDFVNGFINWDISTIINNIPLTLKNILENENIENKKIEVLLNELAFLKTDKDLTETNILKDILQELNEKVIPLFKTKSSYDIIGKFYEEFLRYAGVANVKKGIVLTPNHITTLFTELIDLKYNDIILDPACGTGAFLIAGMNKIIQEIDNSKIPNKEKLKEQVKQEQLLGFEKSSTMYTLSISNMLFRGDGKSKIYNEDFFDEKALQIIKDIKPTIGFVNPPYGGKDNKENPTKKEIQFLELLLDNCSRYVVMIAPLSTYFKDENIRARILSKHTLKYVINMPIELFQPNASTNTAIAVFETNISHGDKKVVLYDLKDDGLILSKNKGRTDTLNKWVNIKNDLLEKIKNPEKYNDNINVVYTKITADDEWIIQAHSKTDYSQLSERDFENTLKEYVIFKTKLKLGLIDKDLKEVDLFDLFRSDNFINIKNIHDSSNTKIEKQNFQEFTLKDLFEVKGSGGNATQFEISAGEYLYVTTSNKNNGVNGTSNIFTQEGNVITIDSATNGKAFYQENNFIGSDHVEVIIPKDFILNKYTSLFFVTILNKECFRYNYGRKRNQTRIKNQKLFLPVKQNNEIDFEYMENYIKSLPYSHLL